MSWQCAGRYEWSRKIGAAFLGISLHASPTPVGAAFCHVTPFESGVYPRRAIFESYCHDRRDTLSQAVLGKSSVELRSILVAVISRPVPKPGDCRSAITTWMLWPFRRFDTLMHE